MLKWWWMGLRFKRGEEIEGEEMDFRARTAVLISERTHLRPLDAKSWYR